MKKIFALLAYVFCSLLSWSQNFEEKAHELLNAYYQNGRFNGTVLVARDDKMLFQGGYGYKSMTTKIRNNVNTIFQIGSVTKQFTSAIILQLQQEDKLSVKDKLSKYFPGFPRGDDISIENLLHHTSGIYNYTMDREFMRDKITFPHSEDQMISLFREKPLNFEPGTQWAYSNSGYVLLGYVIEKVTGKPYETVMRERILTPLGMKRSGFDFTNLKTSDKSTGYFVTPNGNEPSPIVDSTIAFSAGALYSTVVDLYKWDRAIYTDAILKKSSWNTTFTPALNKYGYGWAIDSMFSKNYTAHGGGIHGYASYIIRYPDEKAVIILLDNTGSSQLDDIGRGLSAILFNQPYKVPEKLKEIKVDATILQQYAGTYELTPDFTISVRVADGALKAQATGQQEFDLFAEKEDLFFLKVVDAKVRFVKNDTGVVDKLILYQGGREMAGKKIK